MAYSKTLSFSNNQTVRTSVSYTISLPKLVLSFGIHSALCHLLTRKKFCKAFFPFLNLATCRITVWYWLLLNAVIAFDFLDLVVTSVLELFCLGLWKAMHVKCCVCTQKTFIMDYDLNLKSLNHFQTFVLQCHLYSSFKFYHINC